jgi:hypothetical protein
VNWDLDNANESYFDYEYSCVEKFSSSHSFNEVNAKFNLDIHVITEIAKVFASHVSLPKEGFVEHVELLKKFLYIYVLILFKSFHLSVMMDTMRIHLIPLKLKKTTKF